jgi:hypothetical protein
MRCGAKRAGSSSADESTGCNEIGRGDGDRSAGNEKYEEEFEPTSTHFDRRDLNLYCLVEEEDCIPDLYRICEVTVPTRIFRKVKR